MLSVLNIRNKITGNYDSILALKGERGKSAYEYAVDGGYSGTEAEFRALLVNVETKADLDQNGKVVQSQLPEMNYDALGAASDVQTNLNGHVADTTKHITSSERTTWNNKINSSEKGQANGVCPLGADGKVNASYLPVTGGFVAAASAPTNTSLLWVDTSIGGVMKYHNGTAWVPVLSVYADS